MSALTTIRRLRAAFLEADAPTALPSWAHVRHGVSPAALSAAEAALAQLAHHARTFPVPTALDDVVVKRAALDLTASTR